MTTINILIANSEEENILTLKSSLKGDDIRIFSAPSASQALQLAWENHFTIALIDVDAEAAGGFELAEMLRAKSLNGDMSVIFLISRSSPVNDGFKALGHGIVDYLYKPLNPGITAAKIDSFIRLARFQAGGLAAPAHPRIRAAGELREVGHAEHLPGEPGRHRGVAPLPRQPLDARPGRLQGGGGDELPGKAKGPQMTAAVKDILVRKALIVNAPQAHVFYEMHVDWAAVAGDLPKKSSSP